VSFLFSLDLVIVGSANLTLGECFGRFENALQTFLAETVSVAFRINTKSLVYNYY